MRRRIATSLPKTARVLIRLARRRQALRRSVFLLGQQFERSAQTSFLLRRNARSRSISGELRLRVGLACAQLRLRAGYFFTQAVARRIDARKLAFARRHRFDFGIEHRKLSLQLLAIVKQRAQLDVFRLQLVGLGARFQQALLYSFELALQIGERFGLGSRTAHKRRDARVQSGSHMSGTFLGS